MNLTYHPTDPASHFQRLETAVLQRLKIHETDGTLPTSARFIFYELEGKSDAYGLLVSKDSSLMLKADGTKRVRNSSADLSDALTRLRKKKIIPWSWITDETRDINENTRSKTITSSLEAIKDYARIDPWQHGEVRPFIICESRSLKGALDKICRHYGVNLTSVNGQCAGFLHTELRDCMDSLDEQPVHILYCGDADPQGDDIELNTRTVLQECDLNPFQWERLMLTPKQITQYHLTSITKHDKRKNSGAEYDAWECESLSQKRIVSITENKLAKMLLPLTLEDIGRQETLERETITIGYRAARRVRT